MSFKFIGQQFFTILLVFTTVFDSSLKGHDDFKGIVFYVEKLTQFTVKFLSSESVYDSK